MVQRGPKPIPTQLRVFQGGQGARGVNPDAMTLPALGAPPDPPLWLGDLAQTEWNRVAPLLYGVGVLTDADETMLAAYCAAYGHWRKSEADLATAQALALANPDDKTAGAALVETTNGNLVQNPLIGIVNVARRDMARLATEFGLTPSSRTLIESGKRGEGDATAKKYFGKG